jgi:hypothetical protein
MLRHHRPLQGLVNDANSVSGAALASENEAMAKQANVGMRIPRGS